MTAAVCGMMEVYGEKEPSRKTLYLRVTTMLSRTEKRRQVTAERAKSERDRR